MANKSSKIKYLVLGNSSAACAAVDSIRELDQTGSIAMVSPEPYNAYGTPLISYILKGTSTLESSYIRTGDWYVSNKIEKIFGSGKAAVTLDPNEKVVTLEDGTKLKYEKLLVATGSVPFTPPIKDLPETAENRFTFLTMDKALGIEELIGQIKEEKGEDYPIKAVILGGGLIGAKAAEGLAHHCADIKVLEFADRLLNTVLDTDGANIMQDLLIKHGITPMPYHTTDTVYMSEDGKRVIGCNLLEVRSGEDGKPYTVEVGSLEMDLFITAVGVRPNSAILVEAGAEQGRGIICNNHMKTSLPDVYAAGDLTSVHNSLVGGEAPLALWPNASAQGKIAGYAMAGDDTHTFEGSFAVNAVGFFDEMNILSCGVNPRPSELAEYEVKLIIKDDEYVRFLIKDDRLFGYILLNRPDGAGIYSLLIEEGISLSTLPEDIFDRPITWLDLPYEDRVRNMRKGYMGTEGGAS